MSEGSARVSICRVPVARIASQVRLPPAILAAAHLPGYADRATLRALFCFLLLIACAEREQRAAVEMGAHVAQSVSSASLFSCLVIGFVLSLLGSLPMTGPLALLVLDRVMIGQRRAALWIAISGALVEGAIATLIATLLPLVLQHSTSLVRVGRVGGAAVIFIVGLALVVRPQTVGEIETQRPGQGLLVGFLATSLNPTLLATWTIAVTALHANGLLQGGFWQGPSFGAGVVLGVLGWFGLLVALARLSTPQRMRHYRVALGRGVGGVLLLVSVFTFLHSFQSEGEQKEGQPPVELR